MKINILKVIREKLDREFIMKNGELEMDALADVLEVSADIPFVGSLVKLGKVGSNVMDYLYVRKLYKFLEGSKVEQEKVDEFVSSLDEKEFIRIGHYMTSLLYSSEDEEKALLMGYVYKARLNGEIDNSMMLRLCSIIKLSFVEDLKLLPEYKEGSDKDTIQASNFINWGLIDNDPGGIWYDEPSWDLNNVGITLCEILEKEGWIER